jgi:hypothetical protein
MAGLLYYVPNQTSVTHKRLPAIGLEYAFNGSVACRQTGHGPDGQPAGVILGRDEDMGSLGYYPDRQDWQPVLDLPDPGAWVGKFKTDVPKPEELAREEMLEGHSVKMHDGQWWQIPVLRAIDTEPELAFRCAAPRPFTYLGEGKWGLGPIDQKFERAYQIACDWYDQLVGQIDEEKDTAEFEIDDAISAATVALSINYRIDNNEASLLGLLGSHGVVGEVLRAMIDWPTLEEWVKKNEEEKLLPPDTAG